MSSHKNTIKLGLMPPLTGLVGIYGSEIARAGRIACEEVNEAGGVLGKPLELIIEDDGSLPESAVDAAEKLVRQHGCAAIIGNLLSNSRIAVAYRVAEPHKIPYLNFSFYEGSIQSRYFFHFAALPNQQIDRMIPYMRKHFGPRMFFAGNNYEWPRGSVAAAKLALQRAEGEIVGEEYTPIGVSIQDIDHLLDHAESAQPHVFVPYFAGTDQVNLLTRFTERGMKTRMAVVMGHYDEMMASKLPPDVREGFYSSNTYFMTVDTPQNQAYLQRLAAQPGVTGIWPHGNGILTNFGEGAYVCVKAFAKAANLAGNLDAEALIDALNTLQIEGPQGELRMDPVTHHARVNTYLSRCNREGVFEIMERFGANDPHLPERYNHQRISHQATLEDDIRLQARMLEQMTEGVMLIDTRNQQILYANGGAERLFGYTKNELLGMTRQQLDLASPASGNLTSNEVSTLLAHKGVWQGELCQQHKNGSTVWCSVNFSTFTHPVYGEVWLAVYTDLTARKQAEAQMQASEDRLRRVIEATNDGIWDWNILTHEDYLSPRWKAILGYRDEELENVDSTFFNLLHPDDQPLISAALDQHFTQHTPFHIEVRMRHKDGDYRWILSRGEAVRDAQGQPVRMVGSITDITERKRSDEELARYREHLEEQVAERTQSLEIAKNEAERANRAKSEFLSRMSHELRTPMNAILGFAQVLEYEQLEPEQHDSVLEIHKAGDHLLQLIEELLDLSRIESGKMNVTLQVTTLHEVLRDAVQINHTLFATRQIHCRQQCSADLGVVADPTRLKQILVNLLSNAAKYNRQHGDIVIRCETQGDQVRIAVDDNGPGIPLEKQSLLFKPFERLGAEQSKVDGTGIGLALSKQLTELMGGTMGCDSMPGVGATFWLTLPSATLQYESVEPDVATQESENALKVLYIEDNAANLKVVEAMFRRHPNLNLISATNGEYGLELAHRYLPQVVLLDIHLPGMDGYSVLEALQADPMTREIPVIALSADAMPMDIDMGLKAGFARYLTKPVNMQALLNALEQATTKDKKALQHP